MFHATNKSRITEVDFVRGICILAVHLGHSCIDLGIVTYLWQSFFMSAFFIFSGYFSKPISLKKLLKSTLLLYYLWAVGLHAIMAVRSIRHGVFSVSTWMSELKPIILGTSQPNESAQLWFLVALFTIKLIWSAILHFSSNDRNRFCVTAIIAIIGIILNLNGFRGVPFRLITAMIMLPLFAFGYIISKRNIDIVSAHSSKTLSFFLISIFWCLGTFLNFRIGGRTVSVWSEVFNFLPLFYFNAVSGTMVFLLLSRMIDKSSREIIIHVRNAVCFYGRNSLTAFLTVNFLIIIVGIMLAKLGLSITLSTTYYNIVICISVLLLQIPTAWVLNQPKIARIALLR